MLEEPRATGEQGSVKRPVTIELSQFAFEALAGEDRSGAPTRMKAAVRCYLGDRGAGRPAWTYPAALREKVAQDGVVLELSIDDDLWCSFEEEADRQGVSVQKMSEHAALYFAAEVDAGRITQRILDDLESDSS